MEEENKIQEENSEENSEETSESPTEEDELNLEEDDSTEEASE